MRDLLVVGTLLTLLPLSFVSAFVGVLEWVWFALLQPNDVLFGFGASIPYNKIVAVVTLAVMCFTREKKSFYVDTTTVLLLMFAAVVTVSYMTALVYGPDVDELYSKIIKEIVLYCVITIVVTTRHRLHLLLISVILGLCFVGNKEGFIAILAGGGHQIIGTSSVGDNNSLATALLMIIPLMYFVIQYSAVRIIRLGLWASVALNVITVIMTFSRGGFIGLLVLGALTIKNSRSKILALPLVVIAGIAIYMLAPDSWFQRLNTIEGADNDSSFMGRVVVWKLSLLIAMDNVLFGGGPHAVQHLNVWQAFVPFLYRVDFITTPPADSMPHAAHSIYFEVLGDFGFAGLLIFLSLLIVALWHCRAIRRLAKPHASLMWAADLSRMLEITIIIYAVTGAALSMAYFELVYIMLAITSRCLKTVRETIAEAKRQASSSEPPLALLPAQSWRPKLPPSRWQRPAAVRAEATTRH